MHSHRILAGGCLAAALAFAAAAPVAAAAFGKQAPVAAGAARAASAPVIHEKFTPPACPRKPRTTLQLEGCAEHRVLASDGTIDRLNATVFSQLRKAGRAAFTEANGDWVAYRDAACTAEASIYGGGSVQPVAYANCLVTIDSSHVRELRRMLVALSPAG